MKVFFKVIFLFLILILIAGGVFLLMFDLDKYRGEITQELSKALNRPVNIEKMAMKLSMIPTIQVSGLTIDNSDNNKNPLAQINTVELTAELAPLLNKEIKVKDILVKDVTLNIIEPMADASTEKTKPASSKKKTGLPAKESVNAGLPLNNPYLSQLRVDLITFNNVQINYQQGNIKEQIEVKNATIRQLKTVSADILYHQIPFQLSLNTDLMNLIKMQNNFLFNAQIATLDSSFKVSGNIGNLKTLQNVLLNIDFSTDNLTNTLEKAGVTVQMQIPNTTFSGSIKGSLDNFNIQKFKLDIGEGVNMDLTGKIEQVFSHPQGKLNGNIVLKNTPFIAGLGLKPMSVDINAVLKDNTLTLSNLQFSAHRSDIDSTLKIIKKNSQIDINGTVESNYFDIKDFYEAVDTEPTLTNKSNKSHANTTKTKSNLDWINSVNSQINWTLKNFKPFENMEEYYGISARSTLSDGQLIVNPLHIKTSAGIVNALVRIQNLSQTPNTQISFSGDNINLDKVKEIHEYIEGSTANISGTITTKGLNKNDILSHLSGTVEMEMSQGKIINKWFNNLPQEIGLITKSKSFSYSQTDFNSTLNCAAARLLFDKGVMKMNKSVAIETSTLDMVLNGEISLPQETLSVTLAPSLPNKLQNKVLNAVQAIRIEGPIDNPKMKLDTQKIVSKGIEKGLEKGINKLMEKTGLAETISSDTDENTTQTVHQPLSLCEAALGHKLKGKTIVELPKKNQQITLPQTAPVQQETEKLTPQEILKKQLIKSLSSAIQ